MNYFAYFQKAAVFFQKTAYFEMEESNEILMEKRTAATRGALNFDALYCSIGEGEVLMQARRVMGSGVAGFLQAGVPLPACVQPFQAFLNLIMAYHQLLPPGVAGLIPFRVRIAGRRVISA